MARLTLALLALLALATPAGAAELEVFGPDGTITRVEVPARAPGTVMRAQAEALADSGVTALHVSGPGENRIDLVIVGDGYTADEQARFLGQARAQWEKVRTTSPFREYASLFNVWAVEVVSSESGVDNDPRPPTRRATALDMEFWCMGVERALCVNQAKARAAAEAAPDADQILALANSTKYGGLGGGVATSSGGSRAASLITVHELGHSLGRLVDEYDYFLRAGLSEDSTEDVRIPVPFLVYPEPVSGEPDAVNATAASSGAELVSSQLKWWRWVGEPAAEGGTVDAYEGAWAYRYGLFRPSPDSLMHSLGIAKGGNEFNAPSAEQLVRRFYERVSPLDGATPEGVVGAGAVLEVRPIQPAAHALEIRWAVDGMEVEAARGARSFTVTPELAESGAAVTAIVTDPTPLVRDPALRAAHLTATVRWMTRG